MGEIFLNQNTENGHIKVCANLRHPVGRNIPIALEHWNDVWGLLGGEIKGFLSNIDYFIDYFSRCQGTGFTMQDSTNYKSFSIENNNHLQACMVVDDSGRHFTYSDNEPTVYVELLEVAPWNNRNLVKLPSFELSGLNLMQEAVKCSIGKGFEGRVALMSYDQSRSFYGDRLGMEPINFVSTPDSTRFELLPDSEFCKHVANGI